MEIHVEQVVGGLAAVNLAVLLLPQVRRTWVSRDASGLSLAMVGLNVSAGSLWVTYGILIRKLPLILANSCLLLAAISLLAMKIIFVPPPERGGAVPR